MNSSVLVWPDRAEVHRAAREWAIRTRRSRPDLRRLGYFGSYARGDWGVGSDLDLVAVVSTADEPFERRSLSWDVATLPVPADLIVYTESEWDRLRAEPSRFARMLAREVVWLFPDSSPG
ncbi:MAG TPA: nucleotidyltransferase domain-containing protein [Vicinamibacteria bacterium]